MSIVYRTVPKKYPATPRSAYTPQRGSKVIHIRVSSPKIDVIIARIRSIAVGADLFSTRYRDESWIFGIAENLVHRGKIYRYMK